MDKDTTKSTFFKALEALPYEKFLEIVANHQTDRYVKKAKFLKLLHLMIIAQYMGLESLRAIADLVNNDKQVQEALHLNSISASTLSKRLRKVKHQVWEEIFREVKKVAWQRAKNRKPGSWTYQLNVIDASTITLSLNKYLWADYRKSKGGIKLHQSIVVHEEGVYPDHAVLTTARTADKKVMDELIVLAEDVLNVFDRGYVDYTKWDQYCAKGIRFVSRLKSNALVQVIDEISSTERSGLKERIVFLGNPLTNQMKHRVRLIETHDQDGELVIIVTNDLTMPVSEISDIYRLRWQIELFFKWIKQHLVVKKFIGTSPNAVYGQIWAALIGYCLLLNLNEQLPKKVSLLEVLRAVRVFMWLPFSEMVAALSREPARTSRGRRPSIKNDFDNLLKELSQSGTYELDAADREQLYV